jgi:hypothetical protein
MGNAVVETNLMKEFTHQKTNQMSGTKEINDSECFSQSDSYYPGYNPYGPSFKTKKFIEKIAPNLRETEIQ